MDFELLSIGLFFGIIATLIIIDRKNIEFGLMFIRRTERGRDRIKNFANSHKKFFNIFGNVAVVLAILLSVFGFLYLLRFQSAVRLVLPKVFPGEVSAGVEKVVFFVPLWYWVIGLFVILIPHELFHGFLFAVEKIKIKSTGLILFLIFPGGFVEPDEKQFKNSRPITRIRVASVGSVANICVGIFLILLVLLWNFLGSILYQGIGVSFEGTMPDTPAAGVGLKGMITEINGQRIKDLVDLSDVMKKVNPGEVIRVATTEGEYDIKTIENPDNSSYSFIGISRVSTKLEYKNGFSPLGDPSKSLIVYSWVSGLLGWIFMLDISIAVANLLPFLPFDGGVIWEGIFEKITKKKDLAKKMIKVLSAVTYALLVINLIGLKVFG